MLLRDQTTWKRRFEEVEVRNKSIVFELGKTPNVDKKSLVLVVNEFWDCVEVVLYCWFGLVLYSVCKKGKC